MSDADFRLEEWDNPKRATFEPERRYGPPIKIQIPRIHFSGPEEIVTDSNTGGMKGRKKAAFDLIPPSALWALAEHYGLAGTKYPRGNWAKGFDWSLSYAALHRHLNQFWSGEDIDPENGSHHLIAAAWHAFTLYVFATEGLGTDDRPSYS